MTVLETSGIDCVGDIHGCLHEFIDLVEALGYTGDWDNPLDEDTLNIYHPEERKLVLLGDLTDRGPHNVGMLRLTRVLLRNGHYVLMGNHDNKLFRALKGNPVKMAHGLAGTIAEINEKCTDEEKEEFRAMLEGLPYQLTFHLPGVPPLTVSHAGIPFEYVGRDDKKARAHAIYGEVNGFNEDGTPNRGDSWVESWEGKNHYQVHGHTVVSHVTGQNGVFNIDTGCVFGKELTALRWPELTAVSVPAERDYSIPLLSGKTDA